ncbi:MAG: ABC transporter permease [Nitrospirota bacterium]|nr:ABC transporter permease [Nitrospirota bacterium]
MRKNSVNISAHHIDLITHLVKRNFILRYKGSSIGVLWSLMLPLCQLLVLVFVFRKVVPLNIEDYPVFVFTALLPWIWFSTCLGSAGSLFIGNRDLIRKPDFSPSTLVIVDTLSNLLPYLLFLPVLFLMLFIYSRSMTLSLLYLPLLIMIQGILTAGLGLIIATLNVFYRDVQHIVSVSLMLLFYITPVFYRSQAIAESYRAVFKLNPIAVLIDSYRAVLFYGRVPEWSSLLLVGIISCAICFTGYFIYKRQLHEIIDII